MAEKMLQPSKCVSLFVKDFRKNSGGYVSCLSLHLCLHSSGVCPESRKGKWESCW